MVNNALPSVDNNPLYESDEFRMYSFKVLLCKKRFCHDWTTCPFAHPAEKAKRRDVRTCNYAGVACPDMKKSMHCPRGNRCAFAHNVFEYWLHPSRYRTQLCNEGLNCKRKTCFFAHSMDELRDCKLKGVDAGPAEMDPFSNKGGKNNLHKSSASAKQTLVQASERACKLDPGPSPLLQQEREQHQHQLMMTAQMMNSISRSQPGPQAAMNEQTAHIVAMTAILQQQHQQQQCLDPIMQLAQALADVQLQQQQQQLLQPHMGSQTNLTQQLLLQVQLQQLLAGNQQRQHPLDAGFTLNMQPGGQELLSQMNGQFTDSYSWAASPWGSSVISSPSKSVQDNRGSESNSDDAYSQSFSSALSIGYPHLDLGCM